MMDTVEFVDLSTLNLEQARVLAYMTEAGHTSDQWLVDHGKMVDEMFYRHGFSAYAAFDALALDRSPPLVVKTLDDVVNRRESKQWRVVKAIRDNPSAVYEALRREELRRNMAQTPTPSWCGPGETSTEPAAKPIDLTGLVLRTPGGEAVRLTINPADSSVQLVPATPENVEAPARKNGASPKRPK